MKITCQFQIYYRQVVELYIDIAHSPNNDQSRYSHQYFQMQVNGVLKINASP